MSSSAVSVRQVTKGYLKGTYALSNINFELAGDQIVGLLGPNGAGKTTLINTMMGFIFPSSGDIEVFGKQPRHAYARIGFVSERPNYHLSFSANRLLLYLAAMHGIEKRARRQRCEEALARVGLAGSGDKPLWKMSKGMLQRFSLAQSLLHDPDLLIMDEPMSGLDPLGQKEFRDIVTGLRRPGRTIIFSSHLLFHLEKICDSVLVLDRGILKYHGDAGGDGAAARTVIRVAQRLSAEQIKYLTDAGAVIADGAIKIKSEKDCIKAILRFLLDQDLDVEEVLRDEGSLEEFFIEKLGARV